MNKKQRKELAEMIVRELKSLTEKAGDSLEVRRAIATCAITDLFLDVDMKDLKRELTLIEKEVSFLFEEALEFHKETVRLEKE